MIFVSCATRTCGAAISKRCKAIRNESKRAGLMLDVKNKRLAIRPLTAFDRITAENALALILKYECACHETWRTKHVIRQTARWRQLAGRLISNDTGDV